jgi:fumarate reductase subunit D
MAVVLTNLPLRSGRHPVTAHASAQDRVGLVSVPALGAVNLDERVEDAVLNLVDGILGERVGRWGARTGRRGRMNGRLRELASPLGAARIRDEGTIRFTTAVVRGNLRLLAGMVRANNPSLVVMRLSRALAAAGGTAAYALSSASIWILADGASWSRLAAISLATLTATIVTLIVSHHLWETAHRSDDREQVTLFNLATVATVLIGVVTLYLALVIIALACSYVLIAPGPFAQQLGHAARLSDHLQLAFMTSAIATLAGALGSLTENDFAVREAMYRYQLDARTEEELAPDGHEQERVVARG